MTKETVCSLKGIRADGFARGKSVASWCDMPEFGKTYRTESDGDVVCEDRDLAADIMQSLAYEAESNGREYSPFEFTAHALNEREDSEEAWEAYQEGIDAGISAEISARIANLSDDWFTADET